MVSTKINSNVNYIEKKTIDSEDTGHESCFYSLEILDVPILIVLGKQKYTYSSKNVIYYPIYVVDDNERIRAQIGVFESSLKNVINLVDRDGDIDLDKMGEPLIYSFVTKEFLLKTKTNPKKYLDELDLEKEPDYGKKEELDVEKQDSSDDELDVLSIKVAKNKISEEKQKTDRIIEKGIFSVEENVRLPKMLEEETKHDSDRIKIEYKESSVNNWIQKFLRNNHYDILENEGQGDCFFAAIRDAFKQIGQKTTVEKMRTLLAAQITDSVYQEHRVLYDNFETEKKEIEKSLKELKNTNQILKKRSKDMNPSEIEKNVLEIKEKYREQMAEYKNTKSLQEEYVGYMKNIHSLEEFRHYITTSQFWADAWAISTLESLLKIKVVILSEESYKEKEFDNVLNCGEVNKRTESAESTFEPNYYIILAYNGSHYRLITYYKKGILTFKELPYDIKILIVNKCLEKNAGIFYLIQDFRNFKTLLGVDPDEGNPREDSSSEGFQNQVISKPKNGMVDCLMLTLLL